MDVDGSGERCFVNMVMVRLVKRLHRTLLSGSDPAQSSLRWSPQSRLVHHSQSVTRQKIAEEGYGVDLGGR